MQDTKLNHALELLSFAETHQRHTDALARATGEHFNIFHILRVGHLEVTTHSPFLAELLNPKGKHGQGATFLRLFLTKFGIKDFDANNATVKLEHFIGRVTETSGGRVDIFITDGKGSMILIENKIYAADQENQIKRYRGYNSKASLFYLTREGEPPIGLSDDELKLLDCRPISYATEILSWLKECHKEATHLPSVRETIAQYIHLIEYLTNQSTTIRMDKELIDKIIGRKECLAAFFKLRQAQTSVEDALVAKAHEELKKIAKELELQPTQSGSWREKYGGFAFTTAALQSCNLKIRFEFERSGFQDFFFGFCLIDKDKSGCDSAVITLLRDKFAAQFAMDKSSDQNNVWPAWAWWPQRIWQSEDFEQLQSGQFATDVKSVLEKLAEIAKEVCTCSAHEGKHAPAQ